MKKVEKKLSKNLKTISMGAFISTGITEITIPEGVTAIDPVAFYTCKSLTKASLPKSLTSIDDKAFGECGALSKVVYNGTKAQLSAVTIGEGNEALTSASVKYASDSSASNYPIITAVDYNTQYHQFKLTWTPVEGAENYGIAVYLANKWKVQTQNISGKTTTFISPKLTPGKSYKVAVAAKVNGKWDSDNIVKRAVTVTIK